MRFKYISVLFLIVFTNNLFSEVFIGYDKTPEESDSTEVKQEKSDFNINYSNIVDSLLNNWYVKKIMDRYENGFNLIAIDSTTPVYSDSMCKLQLQAIPAEFDLVFNSKVKKQIKFYTKRTKRNNELILALAEYYFPMFEAEFDKAGVPDELKYLAVIESALNNTIRSYAGAQGLWQFIHQTAKEYKLEINSLVDERNDPLKSTKAAAIYLKDLYKIYGDWALVIAAYNCGPGNVNKAIRRTKKTTYWEIYNYLPRETRDYVPAFIAATYMFNYHKLYNFEARKLNISKKTDTFMIHKKLHLKQVSEVLNIDIEQLRFLNPQYKKDIIPASNEKKYCLVLPFEYISKFIDAEDTLYEHKDSIFFDNKNLRAIKIAEKQNKSRSYRGRQTAWEKPKAIVGTQPPGTSKLFYTVKNGDNYGYIASWYKVSYKKLKQWNGVYSNSLHPGDKLVVYVPNSKKTKCALINNMSFDEKQKMIGGRLNGEKSTKTKYIYHTVKDGETIYSISNKYKGISVKDIMILNQILSPQNIKKGDRLKIIENK